MARNFGNTGRSGRTPMLIAVMGITGVGKTYFISKATGIEMDLGDSLEPDTPKIQLHRFWQGNTEIILADTPGFDDFKKPDIVLLEEFVEFLKIKSSYGLNLSGIIYLHRINDNRIQGSAQKNLNLLTELCGDEFLSHVILVTTMWNTIERDVSEAREEKLKSKFWKGLLEKNAKLARFDGSPNSAHEIIGMLSSEELSDSTLPCIELESIHRGKPIPDTKAGQIIVSQLRDKRQQYSRYLSDAEIQRDRIVEQGYTSNDSEFAQIEQEISELQGQIQELAEMETKYNLDLSEEPQARKRGFPDLPVPVARDHQSGFYQPSNWTQDIPISPTLAENRGIPKNQRERDDYPGNIGMTLMPHDQPDTYTQSQGYQSQSYQAPISNQSVRQNLPMSQNFPDRQIRLEKQNRFEKQNRPERQKRPEIQDQSGGFNISGPFDQRDTHDYSEKYGQSMVQDRPKTPDDSQVFNMSGLSDQLDTHDHLEEYNQSIGQESSRSQPWNPDMFSELQSNLNQTPSETLAFPSIQQHGPGSKRHRPMENAFQRPEHTQSGNWGGAGFQRGFEGNY